MDVVSEAGWLSDTKTASVLSPGKE
jgi:hypothetical protein